MTTKRTYTCNLCGDATQEGAGVGVIFMVRNMLEGLPEEAVEISVTPAIYSDVRRALVERGRGGVILERPLPRRIEMTGVTLVERAEAKP